MKHHFLSCSVVAVAVVFAVSFVIVPHVTSQAPAGARGANPASRPTPHLADGRPDLNGTWDHDGGISFVRPQTLADGSICVLGCPPAAGTAPRGGGGNPAGRGAGARGGGQAAAPNFPKYKSEFLAKVKDLSDRQVQTDTALQCQPPGVPRIGPPAKVIQSAREVVFLYDDINGSFFRIIPTDGRPHRKGLPSSYLGDAIGRWEGDTLVVETVNFNEETWLIDNGAFHTADLKVVERLRRVGDSIEYQAVAHDPAVLVEPWAMRPQTLRLTDQEIEESPRCEDRDIEHIIDGSHHDNVR
jgi:hypothetical protein